MAPVFQAVLQAALASVSAGKPHAGSGHGPSHGPLLLQVASSAGLHSGEEPIARRGASLAEMLHLAKDAAHSALGTAGSANRNATQATWAEKMIDDINADIVPGIAADHKVDQQRLDNAAGKIRSCLLNLQGTNETEIVPLKAAIANEKRELDKQMEVLQDLNETSTILCNSTHTFLVSHSCVLPMRLDPAEMASYMDCVEKWLAESQSLHRKCDEAHDNTTGHEQFVRELQQNHTMRKCSLATLRSNACGTWTACRDEHDADYAQLVEEVVKSAKGREIEVQTLTKITCFLDIVVMSPEELATAEGQTKLSDCEEDNLASSTLNLSFDFPSVPKTTTCPLEEVESTGCVMPTPPTSAPTPAPTPEPTPEES